MVNTVANVVAGRPNATGGGYVAPTGTALPTDATTALDPAFASFGLIADSGLTESIGRSTQPIKAWGTGTVKVVQDDFLVTYQLTLIEVLNQTVNESVYGDSAVTATAASTTHGAQLAIQLTAAPLPHKVYDFEIQDGNGSMRIAIPDGQITAVGDVTYSDSSVVAYPVTVTCYPDSSGVSAYKYSDDGKKTA